MNKWAYISISLVGLYFLLGKKGTAQGQVPFEISNTESKVLSFSDTIISEGYKQKMDPSVIAAIIHWESAGNQDAKRDEIDAGRVWATSYGLMQVLDRTAEWLKSRYPTLRYSGPMSLYEPVINIETGTKYLVYQFQRYGRNLRWALAGYNAGTCFMIELGKIRECYQSEGWGLFCNTQGVTKVNAYVTGIYGLVQRYRQIYNAMYSNYSEHFNPINFQ